MKLTPEIQARINSLTKEEAQLREACKKDFFTFLRVMNPVYKYGDCHKAAAAKMQECFLQEINLGVFLPRDHLKSHLLINLAAWALTYNPLCRISYTCYSTLLSEKQMGAIKALFTSDRYQHLFPEYIAPTRRKREESKWTADAILLAHPIIRQTNQAEASFSIGTTGSPKTGFHPTHLFFDDLVVESEDGNFPNVMTPEGRAKLGRIVTALQTTKSHGGCCVAVGTYYHANDLYQTWRELKVPQYAMNTAGEEVVVGERNLWEFYVKEVEVDGKFLFPAVKDQFGNKHGWDRQRLEENRTKQLGQRGNLEQFWAQFYNRIQTDDTNRIDRTKFTLLEPGRLLKDGTRWSIQHGNGHERLVIEAGIDFAYSIGKRADYTAIAVVGADSTGMRYVLDLAQYRTEDWSEHVETLVRLYNKWGFHVLKMELNGPQKANAKRLNDLLKERQVYLTINGVSTSKESKETRLARILEPLYSNNMVQHLPNSLIRDLEDQLELLRPKHDDLKDAVATALEDLKVPVRRRKSHNRVRSGFSKYGM